MRVRKLSQKICRIVEGRLRRGSVHHPSLSLSLSLSLHQNHQNLQRNKQGNLRMAAVGVASTSTCMGRRKLRVLASWNISPTPLPVIVDPKKSSKKKPNPLKTQIDTTPTSIKKKKNHLAVFELLTANRTTTQENVDDLYLGYERWLPAAPQVKSPRSIYNATSLAYVGDCIYELYARRHFLFPPLSMDDYNDRVKEVVRCEAQDALLKKLCDDDFLSEEERDVLRWGKNIGSGKTKTKKRAGVAVYNRASSLETLVGYLYLTNVERLEELMLKLGFSTGASTERIL